MDKVKLGRTGLTVSVACLGCGGHSKLGQARGASFGHSVDIVRTALDAGVTFIDTAAAYKTEAIVGEAIKGRRDKVVISTKGLINRPGSPETGLDFVSPAEYRAEIERSLQRLGTDYIDIFHLHGICANQYTRAIDEFLPVVHKMRDEGKIRFTALSERFYLDTGHEMLDVAIKDDHFDVMMVGINMVNQSALKKVLPALKAKNVGIQSMHAVRGKLATQDGVRALVEAVIRSGEVDAKDVDADDPLGFVLTDSDATSIVEACYRYNRHAPGVDTVLFGTGSIEHLKDNLRSIDGKPLPAKVTERLARIFGRVDSVAAD